MRWLLIILSLVLFSGCATVSCPNATRVKEIYSLLPPRQVNKCFYKDNSVSIYYNGVYQYNRPRFGYEKAPSKDNQWSDFGTFDFKGLGSQDNKRDYKQDYTDHDMPSGSARGPYYAE